jgi:hypothetical protein
MCLANAALNRALCYGGPLTLLAGVEAVITGHVLDIIHKGCVRQQSFILVDFVDGMFES